MSYAVAPPWLIRRRMMSMGGHRGRGRRSYGFGPGFPMGPGGYGGRPKVSRGDVRLAILHLLGDVPMHGYQIIQELSQRTGGAWEPSPGSIYPTLQMLEDEGLVQVVSGEGKKVFELTATGQTYLKDADGPPWERFDSEGTSELIALRDLAFQVGSAVMQVGRAGSSDQIKATKEILEDARKRVYKVLAEDDQT